MIVGISPGYPGAGRVLQELHRMAPEKVLFADLSKSPMPKVNIDTLILAGWHPEYMRLVSSLPKRPKQVVVCWTSPIIQSEFERVEFDYMKDILSLLDRGRISAVWYGSGDWVKLTPHVDNRFYCPYPLTLPEWKSVPKRKIDDGVSLIGPLGPRKNVAVQAMAAKRAGYTLHTTDKQADQMLMSIGVKFVSHGWLSDEKYAELVTQMDFGLQASIAGSESFSFVCFDHLSRDIPCFSTVEWLPDELCVDGVDALDPFSLSEHFKRLKAHPSGYWRSWAEVYAESTNSYVKRTFREHLGIEL